MITARQNPATSTVGGGGAVDGKIPAISFQSGSVIGSPQAKLETPPADKATNIIQTSSFGSPREWRNRHVVRRFRLLALSYGGQVAPRNDGVLIFDGEHKFPWRT